MRCVDSEGGLVEEVREATGMEMRDGDQESAQKGAMPPAVLPAPASSRCCSSCQQASLLLEAPPVSLVPLTKWIPTHFFLK